MFGNNKEIENLKATINNLKRRLTLLESKQLDDNLSENKVEFKLPNIPWLAEVESNHNGEFFESLNAEKKIHIWSELLNNIGIFHKKNEFLSHTFLPSFSELEDLSMIKMGQLVFSTIGSAGTIKTNQFNALNFGQFAIDESMYENMIFRIVKMGLRDSLIENYNSTISGNILNVSLKIDDEEHSIEFERGKYLDPKFTEKIIFTIQDNIDPNKGFFFFHSEYGVVLTFLTYYQKSIIDTIFKMKRPMNYVNPGNND